jgi:hypothetical protein
MSTSQLATNVLNFAKDKPEYHTGSVQAALIDYLIAACGKPNKTSLRTECLRPRYASLGPPETQPASPSGLPPTSRLRFNSHAPTENHSRRNALWSKSMQWRGWWRETDLVTYRSDGVTNLPMLLDFLTVFFIVAGCALLWLNLRRRRPRIVITKTDDAHRSASTRHLSDDAEIRALLAALKPPVSEAQEAKEDNADAKRVAEGIANVNKLPD